MADFGEILGLLNQASIEIQCLLIVKSKLFVFQLIRFFKQAIGQIELVDNLVDFIFAQLVIKALQIIDQILFRFLQLAYLLFLHIKAFNRA
jgi:hypothetical protein